MTSGLGVDPTKSGSVITSGTTSQDIQQIFGGLYSPGLVSGGTVTTSPSAMSYTVSAGVAVVQMAAGLNVPIPIPATTVTALAVPVDGPRTDIIYAQQRTPAIDGDSSVIVNYGTTLPPRSVLLKSFNQPAGTSNSAAGSVIGDISYSIPYGAKLPRLFYYQYKTPGNLPSNLTRIGYGQIFLPTDRLVTFKVTALLYANLASGGWDSAHYCEYGFLPNVDNNDLVLWNTPGLNQAYGTYMFESTVALAAGAHTVNLGMIRASGTATAGTFYGTDTKGFGRAGIEFSVTDAGIVV